MTEIPYIATLDGDGGGITWGTGVSYTEYHQSNGMQPTEGGLAPDWRYSFLSASAYM